MKSETLKSKAPLGFLIHEVARLMKRRFEDGARSQGLTLPQWRTLGQIALSERATQATLAAAIDANPMTMSGILDRLEKRGLVLRAVDPNDSRAKVATLTPEGEALYHKARALGLSTYETALEGVSPADRETVMACLSRMRDNLSGQTADQKEPA
jgi:MarR family transcriptional regulator for hemolysin